MSTIKLPQRPVRESKSLLQKIHDPAVIAAIIAAIVSLVAAAISVWSTIYNNSMSKDLANHNTNLAIRREQSDKTTTAFEGALESIRNMKNKIQDVIGDKSVTVEIAEKSLREASEKLDASFSKNVSAIRASDFYIAKVFHETKSPGRRSWDNLEGESSEKTSKVSALSKKNLQPLLNELSTAETVLQEKYDALINNPKIVN